jgi:hypothetical protein
MTSPEGSSRKGYALMNTWTVIPSYRPRLGQLRRCLQSIHPFPADKTVVVSNGSAEQRLGEWDIRMGVKILQDPGDDINISRWWAQGMEYAIQNGASEVLLLNTDALISRRGIQTLAQSIYTLDCSAVGPDYRGICRQVHPGKPDTPLITRDRGQQHWTYRVPGFCMMVRVEDREVREVADPELQVWPDEEMRWWYSDDSIEWQAREARGTALIPGVTVRHPPSGGTLLDETLGAYAQADLAKFVAKWGCEPCLTL